MGVNVREKPKGSGYWWVFINHKGKRKAKKIGKDKKTALEVAKKIEAKLTLGELDIEKEKPKLPLFKEYAEIWLETYVKALRRESTYERYRTILKNHVFQKLGKKPINEITRGEIRELLLNAHGQGLSRSMVELIRNVISGILGYAIDEELIESNPVSGILKRLNLEKNKKIVFEPITQDEVELFLNTCKDYYPDYYTFFLCAFRTGMRLGELLALEWGDIDLNKKFIRVQRSYRKGKINPTKTGKIRRADMSNQLAENFKKLLKKYKSKALISGTEKQTDIIFHRNNKYMEQKYIRRIFKRILQKAGIRDIRFHDIRHTFASLLLSNGESPVYVKEQLGHSSIQITVDIYGHLIPSSNRKAVNRLDTPQQPATYTQPAKTATPQVFKKAVNF
jgi:integrase